MAKQAKEAIKEVGPPTTTRTTADIRAALNPEKTYTLAEAREICEIPQVGDWQSETIRQLKLLFFHLEDPLVFAWLAPDRIEADIPASAALQQFWGDVALNYLEDGTTTETFSARVARHQRLIDAAFLATELEDLKAGGQDSIDAMQKELARLRKPKRRRRK